jgi:hypothetical protein
MLVVLGGEVDPAARLRQPQLHLVVLEQRRHQRVLAAVERPLVLPHHDRVPAPARVATLAAATGITNKSLRALMAGLPHAPRTSGQMTYDLRRLRLAGLIRRIEHTNTYVLTPDGIKFAVFYTKLHNRLLRPLMAADEPQAPPELRQALDTLSQHVDDYISRARLGKAA